MNRWTPWFVAGLVILVMLVLPFFYRKVRTAFLKRKGFAPLADLLRRKDTTAKEFWNQVEARGAKVRMKSRGENAFVNVEDAAVIIDSVPRPTPQSDRFAEQLQVIGLSAVAAGAVSQLLDQADSGEIPAPVLPQRKEEVDREAEPEVVTACGANWSVIRTGEDVFQEDGGERREGLYRIEIDPAALASPVAFYSELLNVPQFGNPHAIVAVTGFFSWMCQCKGLCPEVERWVSAHGIPGANPAADWPAATGDGWERASAIAHSLQRPLRRSIPYRTHEACCWGVAVDICHGRPLCHSRLARALRILSNDRESGFGTACQCWTVISPSRASVFRSISR